MTDPRSELAQQFLAPLTNLINKKQELLKKSKENDELSIHLPKVVETHKQAKVLSKAINECFSALRQDHYKNAINQVRYIDNLRPYMEFFQNSIEKSLIPTDLDTIAILDEIEKYFDPMPEFRQYFVAKAKTAEVNKSNQERPLLQETKPVISTKAILKKAGTTNSIVKSINASSAGMMKAVDELVAFANSFKKK